MLLAPPTAHVNGLDGFFDAHKSLTLLHILPAALLFVLLPLQFLPRFRTRYPRWHRWSGRAILILGAIAALTAIVMSFTMSIGGATESAATILFALFFLAFLALGYRAIRRHKIAQHREWMLRAFGVALGIATIRPIIGVFFATRRLQPEQFFGIAFWLGFSVTLLAAEIWIRSTRPIPTSAPV